MIKMVSSEIFGKLENLWVETLFSPSQTCQTAWKIPPESLGHVKLLA